MMNHPTTRHLLALGALSLTLVTTLSACAPVVVGGVVMGAVVASDRRTTGSQVEDEGIEQRTDAAIRENLSDQVHINVTSYNRQVLLTGEVPSLHEKQRLEQVMTKVENVRAVVNDVAILGNSTLSQRSSDTLVTGRVKAALVDAKDLSTNAFKVTTERGTTYLMGRVTQREANRATEIARSTSGVQKVVRVLEIISEAELQNLLPKAPSDIKK